MSELIPVRRVVSLGDLALEHSHWLNPRSITGLSDDEIAQLGKSIREHGLLNPPHVVQIRANGDIVNLVIDGQRRVRAARDVLPKSTKIEVIDLEADAIDGFSPDKADELMLKALTIGQNREGLSSYELSEVAERMRGRGRKLSEIARAIARDESWVSKMLTARSNATPSLMHSWQKGEVTDESFKDLAAVPAPKQRVKVAEVKQALKEGDKATARMVAKEAVEESKKDRQAKTANGQNGHSNGHAHPPVVSGEQRALFSESGDDGEKPKTEKKTMTARAVLEDVVALEDRRPATHPYVKGVLDGVRFALGFTSPDKFAHPWVTYLARVDGRAAKPKKAKTKKSTPVKAKAVAKAAAKPSRSTKPKKSVKASSKKRKK